MSGEAIDYKPSLLYGVAWERRIVKPPRYTLPPSVRLELYDYLRHKNSVWADALRGARMTWRFMDSQVIRMGDKLVKVEGRITRRISKIIYESTGDKIPGDVANDIGKIVESASDAEKTYELRIVDDFDWDEGDFGDDGSCFWGGSSSRDYLEVNGFLAIQFFRMRTSPVGEGVARCWLAPHAYVGKTIVPTIFNIYGYRHKTVTMAFEQLLRDLTNRDWTNSSVRLNMNGNSVYRNGDAAAFHYPDVNIGESVTVDMYEEPEDYRYG